MSLGKLHAASSRQQDALWVKTTRIPSHSMKWSARRTSRGWSQLMPRDPGTLQNHPTNHPAKSKVLQETSTFMRRLSLLMFTESPASLILLFMFSSYRCKAQGSICRWHAEEERQKKIMVHKWMWSNRVIVWTVTVHYKSLNIYTVYTGLTLSGLEAKETCLIFFITPFIGYHFIFFVCRFYFLYCL